MLFVYRHLMQLQSESASSVNAFRLFGMSVVFHSDLPFAAQLSYVLPHDMPIFGAAITHRA